MTKNATNPTRMTEVTIDGKEYPLHFGLDFIRSLDKIYFVDRDGLKFGTGLIQAMVGLNQSNPLTLQEVVIAATCTHKPTPPSAEKIEFWLYEQDMEQLAKDFLTYFDKSPATAVYLKRLHTLGKIANEA